MEEEVEVWIDSAAVVVEDYAGIEPCYTLVHHISLKAAVLGVILM